MQRVDKSNPAYRHGHAGSKGFSPTYSSWACMVQRATNPNLMHAASYKGRGISIDPRWLEFTAFLEDMGERPEGTTLDRKDVNGNYEPGNCRWATITEQANNKRSSRMATLNGKTQSVTQWCKELGWSHHTVWARIGKWGYTPEEALTRPKQWSDKGAVSRAQCEFSGKSN